MKSIISLFSLGHMISFNTTTSSLSPDRHVVVIRVLSPTVTHTNLRSPGSVGSFTEAAVNVRM